MGVRSCADFFRAANRPFHHGQAAATRNTFSSLRDRANHPLLRAANGGDGGVVLFRLIPHCPQRGNYEAVDGRGRTEGKEEEEEWRPRSRDAFDATDDDRSDDTM